MPSPALMTDADTQPAKRFGAPDELCRITIASTPIASIVCAVSFRLSPFSTADPDTLKFTTSAERRFAASSNDVRVRVDDS